MGRVCAREGRHVAVSSPGRAALLPPIQAPRPAPRAPLDPTLPPQVMLYPQHPPGPRALLLASRTPALLRGRYWHGPGFCGLELIVVSKGRMSAGKRIEIQIQPRDISISLLLLDDIDSYAWLND